MSPRLAILSDLTFDGTRFLREPLSIEVDEGRISGIRPFGGGDFVGREVIDARGDAVIPGLINTHTHLARGGMFDPNEFISADQIARNLRDLLRAGVTTVGEMGCAGGFIHSLRSHTARNPRCGPAIVACGPLLTVRGGYPLDWLPPLNAKLGVALLCETPDMAKLAVHRVAEMGMDHVKMVVMHRSYAEKPLRTLSPEAASALVSEAHTLGFRVFVHAHFPEDYRLALDAGVDALMHSCFDPLDEEMVARVRDSGVYVNPTLWVFEGALTGVEKGFDNDPRYFRHVSSRVRKDWADFRLAYASSGEVVPAGIAGGLPKARGREALANARENLARLCEAGVPMAFGTDASYGFCLLGRPVDELVAMRRAGMSPAECLRAATRNAAGLLGLTDRGVIAVGKRADLVIVDAAVAIEVGKVEGVRTVITAGKVIDDAPASSGLRALSTMGAVLAGVARTACWSMRGGGTGRGSSTSCA